MTAAVGDEGKEGVTRNIGYYDDRDGVYFTVANTTAGVALRSSVTGSVVDTIIPQSEWNGDRLTGEGGAFNTSGFTLDISKTVPYWIDLMWLGAGTVRYGVLIEGQRIVIHSLHNANYKTTTYMRTGSLPIRYEQFNTGVTASTSEFKFYCATVKTEGEYTPHEHTQSGVFEAATNGTTEVVVAAFRPIQTFKSKDNRSSVKFASVSTFNGSDTAILVDVTRGGTVTGGTFNAHASSSVLEHNTAASSISGDESVRSMIIAPGKTGVLINDSENTLYRNADITQSTTVNIKIRQLTAGAVGTISTVMNWNELEK